MNAIKTVILMGAGLLISLNLLQAQTAFGNFNTLGSFNNDLGPVQSSTPDDIVQITAEAEGLTLVDPTTLPLIAPCWWTVFPGGGPVPMPCPPQDLSVPIYEIISGSGIYLVDETGGAVSMSIPRTGGMRTMTGNAVAAAVERQGNAIADLIEQVQETEFEHTMAMAFGMDIPTPGDGGGDGGGTNSYSPNGSGFSADYGTNLWIAQTTVANGWLAGIGTNTIADIQYEIQSRTNLLQADWQSEGFIFGSETTNWTPLSVAQNGRQTLFLRLRSWATDASGLPMWWQFQYFGTNGADPYGNPSGDGWDNYQKFLKGWNPNQFYTPPVPQGLTVHFHQSSNNATITWSSSPGMVTGYILEKTDDYDGTVQDFTNLATSTSFLDDLSGVSPDPLNALNYDVSYRLRANYTNGNSSPWTASLPLQQPTVSAVVTPGTNGMAYLAVSGVPANATTVRLVFLDEDALYYDDPSFDYTKDIPVSYFTNGLYPLPAAWQPGPDTYGFDNNDIFVESLDSNGDPSGATLFYTSDDWSTPFYDGRVQLKQNLIFQLRAATINEAFGYYTGPGYALENWGNPRVLSSNYAVSSFYQNFYWEYPFNYPGGYYYPVDPPTFNSLLPFQENYLFENCAFDPSLMQNVLLGTGIFPGSSWPADDYLVISSTPLFMFTNPPATGGATIPALGPDQARWLAAGRYVFGPGLSDDIGVNDLSYMTNNARNLFGLPFLSTEIAWNSNGVHTLTLYPGQTGPAGYFYTETAQPQLQTVEYDFWKSGYGTESLPEQSSFSPTNQSSKLLFVAVGHSMQIAGYAKMSMVNGYSDVYAYLGQYFDRAYKATNDIATTNPTGVLSPYGNFFASEPGDATLLTMPDVDTGTRGTGIVHCVSVNVDKNHDGVMDLSFGGADATSQSSPMLFWVNNDTDWSYFNGDVGQDVVTPTNNGDYGDYTFQNVSNQRDLEDFARLWICGLPSLTNGGYQVKLSWQVNSGNPAINLIKPVETNGGTLYLTDSNTAAVQVAGSTSASPSYKFARVTSSQSYTFPANYFTGGDKYFLFEGAGIGSGELLLTVSDNAGNLIARTGVWLDLHDIKDFYEQAHAGNVTSGLPPSSLISQCQIDHTTTDSDGETKQVIVFVHGINNTQFNYYNTTETIFKRLYWSGYHGKVAGFRWPCAYLPFENTLNPFNYNIGEFYAWKSAFALRVYLNYLRNRPDLTNYTINILAHSQGNVVASEAIKQGGAFDNYILSQGAVPAHCYDTEAPFLQNLVDADAATHTPFSTTNGGYNGYFSSVNVGGGRLIDFYNTNDFALATGVYLGKQANWVADQESQKPEDFSWRLGQYYHYYSNGVCIAYYTIDQYNVADPYEIMAMVARSRSSAVGAKSGLGGAIGSSVDLKASFNFSNTRDEHSAQFNRPIQTVLGYYQQILLEINPP